ncbi:phosphotransferase system mannose-type iia component [Lucifera butyrica]|uniref:phosphoenolpyruvate--glycerone phosphotransferase n=1 Tax=Lucifera butyrica TaxID=1351585 RepID=A0A498R944_9FIRM|nr:dihydroxyacetone kinase phosphoryl donor subunit DhaM [Lucifera butyrica]VBB06663.1 phosphotransferase system mannose-type iia component [Lucifera butyrica]
MVGMVIVSHSRKAADGIKELAAQMAGPGLNLIAAGGMNDGAIGTDAVRISEAIVRADSGDGVVVLVDLGSAVLSTETAIELLPGEIDVKIADAPILEGSIMAAVEASVGSPLAAVIAAAEGSRSMVKLS